MDTPAGERAEMELRRLIEKRHDPRDGEGLLEPSYAESVRRFNERVREENRTQWANFHQKMSELHRWLSEEHTQKAKLCESEKGQ